MRDYPEPTQWNGDDTRDELSPDPEADVCASCGALPEEPCEVWCECKYCLRHRHHDEDAA